MDYYEQIALELCESHKKFRHTMRHIISTCFIVQIMSWPNRCFAREGIFAARYLHIGVMSWKVCSLKFKLVTTSKNVHQILYRCCEQLD